MFDKLQQVPDIFSSGRHIGRAKVTEHTITLHDYRPIYQQPRRFPKPVSDEIDRQCQELYDINVNEPSESAWASPVVPVCKRNESLRLCIDDR